VTRPTSHPASRERDTLTKLNRAGMVKLMKLIAVAIARANTDLTEASSPSTSRVASEKGERLQVEHEQGAR